MRKPLVLVPTSMERNILVDRIQSSIQEAGGSLCVCGFGPIAASARTSQLLAELQPEFVVLVGIAGAIVDELPVGTAWTFDEVACYGVGVGTGDSFTTAASLGWPQWAGNEDSATIPATSGNEVLTLVRGDAIPLDRQNVRLMQLLTCCAGSSDLNDVELKTRYFPNAVAEDMEGFGVALACSLVNVPLTIVRGISNVAGDRDKSRWQVDQALRSAAHQVLRLIADDGPRS